MIYVYTFNFYTFNFSYSLYFIQVLTPPTPPNTLHVPKTNFLNSIAVSPPLLKKLAANTHIY